MAGVYFCQTSVFYFCMGLSCCPYHRVSARLELTICETVFLMNTVDSRLVDTPKTNYSCLTEIISRYYGLSLMRTLTSGPYGVCFKGSWLHEEFAVSLREFKALVNVAL